MNVAYLPIHMNWWRGKGDNHECQHLSALAVVLAVLTSLTSKKMHPRGVGCEGWRFKPIVLVNRFETQPPKQPSMDSSVGWGATARI
jgi:hypothetical protein